MQVLHSPPKGPKIKKWKLERQYISVDKQTNAKPHIRNM